MDGKDNAKKYDNWIEAINLNKKNEFKYGIVIDKLVIIDNYFFVKGSQNGCILSKDLLRENKKKFLDSHCYLKMITNTINSSQISRPKKKTQLTFESQTNNTTPRRSRVQIQSQTPITQCANTAKRDKTEMDDESEDENNQNTKVCV